MCCVNEFFGCKQSMKLILHPPTHLFWMSTKEFSCLLVQFQFKSLFIVYPHILATYKGTTLVLLLQCPIGLINIAKNKTRKMRHFPAWSGYGYPQGRCLRVEFRRFFSSSEKVCYCSRFRALSLVQRLNYRKDTEHFYIMLCVLTYITLFWHLSITCNAFIACFIRR